MQSDQFHFDLPSGRYRCEQGIQLTLRRHPPMPHGEHLELEWQGRNYLLQRDPSASGLPRYEHGGTGLVWIDLPWKGLLLDGRTQSPIANECRN